jgi:acyl-CoA thioesterase-2
MSSAGLDFSALLVDDVLVVDPLGVDRFRSRVSAGVFDRIYGGHTVAQALLAAAATVPADRAVHSLHIYYLRLGNPDSHIEYAVRRLRDSRSYSARSVSAYQAGQQIAEVMVSFHVGNPSFSHQAAMPQAPDPEVLASRPDALAAAMGKETPQNAPASWPIDMRYIDHGPWQAEDRSAANRLWMRVTAPLPDSPLIHAAALAYASDLAMFEVVVQPQELRWSDLIDGRGAFGASLDHSVWFHEPVRADEWLLHTQESPRSGHGRGLATGHFFSRDGRLVATVAQEITVTVIEAPSPEVTGEVEVPSCGADEVDD